MSQNDFEEKMGKFEKMYQIEKYNEDTICAIANIQKNKHLIKSRTKLIKLGDKFERAMDMVIDAYPQADRVIITRELAKIGLFRRSAIRTMAYLVLIPCTLGTVRYIAPTDMSNIFLVIFSLLASFLSFAFLQMAFVANDLMDD